MSYKKALERFKAVPEEDRRLAVGFYSAGTIKPNFCAIGVVCPATRELPLEDCCTEIEALFNAFDSIAVAIGETGMTIAEAQKLQAKNDSLVAYNHRLRFNRVLNWLEEQVAKEATTT